MATNAPCARTKILVAIDDSKPAQWAMQVASAFAKRMNAEVILVSVIPTPMPVVADAVFYETESAWRDRLQEEASMLLCNARDSLPPTVPCETVVREGDAPIEIVDLARAKNVNLIVLGSRGRNRFSQFVLGSTAEAVLRKAHCPVMTVANEPVRCASASAQSERVCCGKAAAASK